MTEFIKFLGATIAVFFSIAVLIPILPQYVHSVLQGNDFVVGVVMAMQAIGAISSRMIVGSVIASRGTKAAMILGSYFCVAGSLFYFLADSFLTIGWARFIQGIGEGFVFTSGTTWVLNTAPKDQRGQMVAFFGLSLWLGSSFAPPLGAYTVEHFGFSSAWVLAVIGAIMGLGIMYTTEQTHTRSKEKIKLEFIPQESLRPGITLCLASAGYVAIATFSILYFSYKGWQGGALPIAAFGLGFVCMRFFGGKMLDKMSIKGVAARSALLEAAGLLGVILSPTAVVFVVCSFIAGLGMALMYPAGAMTAVQGVNLHRQGTVIGWYTAFWDLSLLLSNVIFGWIAKEMGYEALFVGALISTLLSLAMVMTWHKSGIQTA